MFSFVDGFDGLRGRRAVADQSLDMLAPGGARETARDENSERRRLAAAVSTAMASEDPASLVELRAACGTPLAISLVCRDGATPLMAFARHGCQDDVARLVASRGGLEKE